jgi:hypothetical protein
MDHYRDRFVHMDGQGITVRWYGFPFGTKHVPWTALRGATRRTIGPLTGQWRLWGTGDLKHWYHLDPERPRKTEAFVLDLDGGWFRPVLTPDDPAAFSMQLRKHGVIPR